MSTYWMLIIIYLLYLYHESEPAIAVRKFVYQKDMSEYCRRRVVPSIFLGRHVVEANSQILHFSRMELPYSCFISVRTESGSNIIFFIQLVSEDSLKNACSESENQLLVYEMGETFGGYWGPLPETLLMQRKNQESNTYYTLKTTQPTTASTKVSSEEELDYSATEATEIVSQTTSKRKEADDTGGDYITMEIPIVNVSGLLVPGKEQPKDFDIDETFDLIYDVAPRRGEQYKTSIIPLVQFSISEQKGPRRSGDTVPRYQLDYDINTFTPDTRLTYPKIQLTSTKKKKYKYGYNVNRRLKYTKNNRLFAARKPSLYLKQHFTPPSVSKQTTSSYDINFNTNHFVKADIQQIPMTVINDTKVEYNDTWAYINNLMETLKRNTESDNLEKSEESPNVSAMLHNLSNMHHNFSAYLGPEPLLNSDLTRGEPKYILEKFSPDAASSTLSISTFYDREYDTTTSTDIKSTSKLVEEEVIEHKHLENIMSTLPDFNNTLKGLLNDVQMNIPSFNNLNNGAKINPEIKEVLENASFNNLNSQLINYSTTTTTSVSAPIFPTVIADNIIESNPENMLSFENITNSQILKENHNSSTVESTNMETPSTVDHESWENVVQAASDMAVILNHAYDNNNMSNDYNKLNVTKHGRDENNAVRKKRYIHSVPIQDARPHNLSTRKDILTTTTSTYRVADLQDFAQLAELQDDEIHGRVALRYLRHYVGPVMFNICDYHEYKDRQVFLFNSSRIVIAITNFTMDRITIVVTPARTLLNSEARCSSAHLECQISGTRVCIDSMSACDGVPNCGTYDIYDEDRLMCGGAVGLQHNVCLAAFTFLAVLLTMLYTVHYWLKRCVPKVSDAFFIYANGAENILYLDTIMRSPTDLDDSTKMACHGNIFDDDIIYSNASDISKPSNQFMQFLWNLPGLRLLKGKRKKQFQEEIINSEFYKTNMEPRKMYSFTEFEIQKIIGKKLTNAAVQTGESLEMEHLTRLKKKEGCKNYTERPLVKIAKRTSKSLMPKDDTALNSLENASHRQSQIDELSILNYFRDVRSESFGSTSNEARQQLKDKIKNDTIEEEKEILCHTYEPHDLCKPGPSERPKFDIPSQTQPPETLGQVRKHLRFEKEATTIPSEEYEEGQTKGKESQGRRSVSFVGGKIWRALDFNTVAEDNDEDVNTEREHRSFWRGNKKVKKSKKNNK